MPYYLYTLDQGAWVPVRGSGTAPPAPPKVLSESGVGFDLLTVPEATKRIVFALGTGSASFVVDKPTTDETGGVRARKADDTIEHAGVGVHLSKSAYVSGSRFTTIIQPALADLGIRYLRDAFTANSTTLGRMTTLYNALGIRFILTTAMNRSDLTTGAAAGSNETDWTDLRPSFNTLRDAWWAVSGTNEPNGSSLADPAVTRNTAGVITSYAASTEVLSQTGKTWSSRSKDAQRSLWNTVQNDSALKAALLVVGTELIAAGSDLNLLPDNWLAAYCDIAGWHAYDGARRPQINPSLGQESKVLSNYGQTSTLVNGYKQIFMTETGYHHALLNNVNGHIPTSERATGKYAPQLLLSHIHLLRYRFVSFYEFIDEGTSDTDLEQRFGLVRNDGSYTDAFLALQYMFALFDDPGASGFTTGLLRYTLNGAPTDLQSVLLQHSNGHFFLCLWRGLSSWDFAHPAGYRGANNTLPYWTEAQNIEVAPVNVTVQFPIPRTKVVVHNLDPAATGPTTSLNVTSKVVAVADYVKIVEVTL